MSESASFLDTNVLLRHFLDDHPEHSPRATALIDAIAHNERAVWITDSVIFETVFILHKSYGVPRTVVHDLVLEFIHLPGVMLANKRMMDAVFALFVDQPGLSFADAYHATFCQQFGVETMLSFDRKIGRVPGIRRIEP